MKLTLIGIGTGNPEHLTLQAVRAMNAQDVILIPQKGPVKDDLAQLRRDICARMIENADVEIVEFELPVRDPEIADYRARVDAWHDAIALRWREACVGRGEGARVALLVWGDPSLYDSTLRIAARLSPAPEIEVIPGITSLQGLTAAHGAVLNEIGAPFIVTTGRRLRDEGWPEGVDTVAVMLDGDCAFQTLEPDGIHIWWGAFVGMPQQIITEGPLQQTGPRILQMRAEARASHGWIMDIYLLRRG